VKVKQLEKTNPKYGNQLLENEPEETLDVAGIYQSMVDLMQPGETVQKAIKRLGGNKAAAGHGTKRVFKRKASAAKDGGVEKNNAQASESMDTSGEQAEKSEKNDLLTFIGYADKLLSFNGEMEIYQDTYEKLSFKLKNLRDSMAPPSSVPSVRHAIDSGLDIFADEQPPAKKIALSVDSVDIFADSPLTGQNTSAKSEKTSSGLSGFHLKILLGETE
jgi:hypothetical protein